MSTNNGLLVLSRKALQPENPLETIVLIDEEGKMLGRIGLVETRSGSGRIALLMDPNITIMRGEIAIVKPGEEPLDEVTQQPKFKGPGLTAEQAGIEIKRPGMKKLKVVGPLSDHVKKAS